MNFEGFPKIPRLNREIIITEKIDGSNGQIRITSDPCDGGELCSVGEFKVFAGSRNRWLSVGREGREKAQDNFGFAAWVYDNAEDLVRVLGEGRHFGEWWGKGIQRTYDVADKYFSLFNTTRWAHIMDPFARDALGIKSLNLLIVPELYVGPRVMGMYETAVMADPAQNALIELRRTGSRASRGFMDPEGIVVYHTASKQLYKATCQMDEQAKGAK